MRDAFENTKSGKAPPLPLLWGEKAMEESCHVPLETLE
jgi:hypothetical protein